MQIISRKDAIADHINQYFTGKPCKKGHVTYRYTASGTCAACVAISASATRGRQHSGVPVPRAETEAATVAKIQATLFARQQKQDALAGLVNIKLAIYPQDIETVFDTAVALCLAEYPHLEPRDVRPSIQPVKGGIPVYLVSVPPSQIEFMRQLETALRQVHGPDIRAERARIFDQLARAAEAEADTPPEGRM